jgi:hypothetical protein
LGLTKAEVVDGDETASVARRSRAMFDVMAILKRNGRMKSFYRGRIS